MFAIFKLYGGSRGWKLALSNPNYSNDEQKQQPIFLCYAGKDEDNDTYGVGRDILEDPNLNHVYHLDYHATYTFLTKYYKDEDDEPIRHFRSCIDRNYSDGHVCFDQLDFFMTKDEWEERDSAAFTTAILKVTGIMSTRLTNLLSSDMGTLQLQNQVSYDYILVYQRILPLLVFVLPICVIVWYTAISA